MRGYLEVAIAYLIGLLVKLSVFVMVFALGLNATREDAIYLERKPGLLARSLFAAYVLTPLIAVALTLLISAPPAVEVGVLLFAISAGAPILPKKLTQLGVSPRCIYSLEIAMALVAVVTVPISLALLRPLFPKAITAAPLDVARVVVASFLAPLLGGMTFRYFLPSLAGRIRQPLMAVAGIVLVGVAVLILAANISAVGALGVQGLLIIVLLTIGALTVGHAMGGPDSNDRTSLAFACATRLPALAMLIASRNFPNAKPLPVVAAYLLVSNLTALPYLFWRKKRGGDRSKEQPPIAA